MQFVNIVECTDNSLYFIDSFLTAIFFYVDKICDT